MRPLTRIHEMIMDLPPGTIPDLQREALLTELKRVQSEYDLLLTRYDRAVQGKAIVHSILQKSSEEMIERYRALFEYSGVPMVILDHEGRITLANSHFLEYTGFSAEEITSTILFSDLADGPDQEKAREYHRMQQENGSEPARHEIRFRARFPAPRDVSLTVGTLPGGSEYLVSLIDITENKQQRAALAAHNHQLMTLLHLNLMEGEPESAITSFTLRTCAEMTKSRMGFIGFPDQEERTISVESYLTDREGKGAGEEAPRLRGMNASLDDLPSIRQVILTREPLILSGSPSLVRTFSCIVQEPVRYHRALIIPVVDQERVVAVLSLADKEEPYSPSDQLELSVLMAGMWRLMVKNRQDEALKTANNKLRLLSSLTRHDIINLITALEGYIELTGDLSDNPDLTRYLQKEHEVVRSIIDIIAFTREYEMVGITAPVWQDVETIFSQAGSLPAGVNISTDIAGVWVYADPLLVRVFSNFIDNSVRHGGQLSRISLSRDRSGNELILVYQDDGCGVEWSEKEKIFARGYGKHTGLGLFLIREIFSITGISIRECGEPGEGVRFEMTVPWGKYRLLGDAGEDEEDMAVKEGEAGL